MANEKCLIFVDDSNIWIEAQKFAASGNSHMPKLEDSDHDPRLRIDIGKLVQRLLGKDRTQGPSFLYGSRPPPNDSVWKIWEKNKFETNIYDRASSGKEKEVDNSMTAGMVKKATILDRDAQSEADLRAKYPDLVGTEAAEEKNKTTFVVITGDRDMMPAVKEVLSCDIRVELWAWMSGISQAYLDLAAINDLLSVFRLDSIFKDICFTAYRSTRKHKGVVGGKTMVLRDVDERDEDAICDRLLNTRQLFWKTRWDGKPDLCIEFPRTGQIEKLILHARQLLPGITILSWPEYRALVNEDPDRYRIKTANRYKPLEPVIPAEDGQDDGGKIPETPQFLPLNNTTQTVSDNTTHDDSNDTGGWETAVGKGNPGKRHRRDVNQQQNCPYGQRCKKKDYCTYKHSDEEWRLFQRHPTRNLGRRNTQMCRYAPRCWNGGDCLYAHTEAEATCLDCGQTGHFQGNTAKCLLRA